MARPRQLSDEEILDVARAAFVEGGPSVTIEAIAERLGLSQAALFKRFGTKERLLLAALQPPDPDAWLGQLADGPDERPAPEQLREIGARALAFYHTVAPRIAVLRAHGVPHAAMFGGCAEPPPIRSARVVAAWFQRGIARGLFRAEDPNVLAMMFIAAWQSRAFWSHMSGAPFPPLSDEAYVDHAVDMFWRGAAPEGA